MSTVKPTVEALAEAEVLKQLAELKQWRFEGDKIKRDYKFKDFLAAFDFMSKIAPIAESQQHHPEWFNVYNKVNVELTTHDAGNKVSTKDFKLAKEMESIFQTFRSSH